MRERRLPVYVAVVSGAALMAIAAQNAYAQAAKPASPVTVVNDATNPVPVVLPASPLPVTLGAGPLPVTIPTPVPVTLPPNPLQVVPPLWQGAPTVATAIVFGTGFEGCQPLYRATAGTALLVRTAVAEFNTPPDIPGRVRIAITLPDGKSTRLTIPAFPSQPVQQVAGTFNGYAGSLDMGNFPITSADLCMSGGSNAENAPAQAWLLGFVVPLPQ